MRFSLRHRLADRQVQENFDALLLALNSVGQFVTWGDGAPAHTPDGPQLYFEQDGPGVHVFNGSWTAL